MPERSSDTRSASAWPSGAAGTDQATVEVRNVTDEPADEFICYCGLYEKCPAWHLMNDAERRACSTDKRMTAEYYWKHRVTGA